MFLNAKIKPVLLCVAAAFTSLGCENSHRDPVQDHDNTHLEKQSHTIVDVAKEAKIFNTLLAVVKAADLEETLQGKGPFTVFAPTDEAFSKIPADTLKTLLQKENINTLREILLYHVVAEKLPAGKVLKMKHLDTVAGKKVKIWMQGKMAMINDATIIKTDIDASNGIVHVIDTVLIPDKAIEKPKKKGQAFKPFVEAPLPKGYPAPGPLDKIVVKDYPSARIAVAKQTQNWLGMNTSFMQLFRHIKKHDISMTSPVQQVRDPETKRMKNMGFYYRNITQGQLGQDKTVEVQDQKSGTFVSVGQRGRTTESAIDIAQMRLEQWLSQNKKFKQDGPLRVLGYNSPFVLPQNRFFEVQIPVALRSVQEN